MRQYAISMGFRVIAFPLGVWAITSGWSVIGWILVVFAMLIPSVAVAFANAVDHRSEQTPLQRVEHDALPTGEPDQLETAEGAEQTTTDRSASDRSPVNEQADIVVDDGVDDKASHRHQRGDLPDESDRTA